MSKKKPPRDKRKSASGKSPEPTHQNRNIRETIESIAIAFILAFLFRTFEAEAFVIPTGSMAPTLQGRHKDVECPKCGFRYRASASSEEDGVKGIRQELANAQSQGERNAIERRIRNFDVVTTTCPMCRYTMRVGEFDEAELNEYPDLGEGSEQTSYNGDRILVSKFAYEFSEPERWDVVVFKFPGDAKMNYIKRLVGLPNEELQIFGGDIYVRPLNAPDEIEFEIARKPAEKVLSMKQIVHDNHYEPTKLIEKHWPARWSVWSEGAANSTGWKEDRNTDGQTLVQTFTNDGQNQGDTWIRYQHFIPSRADWKVLSQGPLPADYPIEPRLITDFYAYNCFEQRGELPTGKYGHAGKRGMHWVGDLTLDCDVDIESGSGELLLDLVEGAFHFQCRIDVASGKATLSIPGVEDFGERTGQTGISGPGSHHISLANVDDQMLLWVDGDRVELDAPAVYDSSTNTRPTGDDLSPAGVGSRGAALRVTGLRIYRDIYYIADDRKSSPMTDYDPQQAPMRGLSQENLNAFLSNPDRWESFDDRANVIFVMRDDQFFVLGDNSPMSKDSRLWRSADGLDHFVPRELLTGKALFIYWPHSWSRIPGTPIPFPFFPNFGDMGLVR